MVPSEQPWADSPHRQKTSKSTLSNFRLIPRVLSLFTVHTNNFYRVCHLRLLKRLKHTSDQTVFSSGVSSNRIAPFPLCDLAPKYRHIWCNANAAVITTAAPSKMSIVDTFIAINAFISPPPTDKLISLSFPFSSLC